MNQDPHQSNPDLQTKAKRPGIRKAALISAALVFGLFGIITMNIVRGAFSEPDIPEPENYETACEYVLANRLGYGDAGVEWIQENTDRPVNAYIGLMGLRAQKEEHPTWPNAPEFNALVELGEDALPAIQKKITELSNLERRRRMDSARMAGLTNDPGYSLPGADISASLAMGIG